MAEIDEDYKKTALEIGRELLEECEYSIIYEDERLEDCTEAEWYDIHRYITHDLIVVPSSDLKEFTEWKTWKAKRAEKFKDEQEQE